LVKRFGEFTAVAGVTFSVAHGTIFGFLGPNGAGKTTTIRMLLGLLTPTEGQARILGYDVAQETQAMRKRLGYMSQKFSLYNDLTVEENLDFYGRVYGLRGKRLAARKAFALEMAGLQDRRRVRTHDLAGGWKQRLALGSAILHEPDVLFLDEPTAGVDPISRRAFWNLLYQLADNGATIFVTTHYMDEAERCQDLAFILDGRIIAQGSPQVIKRTKMRGQVLEVDIARQQEADVREAVVLLREMGCFEEVALYGARIHLVLREVASAALEDAIAAVRATLDAGGMVVRSVEAVLPSLEDVFISQVRARLQTSAQIAHNGDLVEQEDTGET
jgi:ABC-2 type transport system ATP-binding protein